MTRKEKHALELERIKKLSESQKNAKCPGVLRKLVRKEKKAYN